jgi:hypothetical protein
MKHLKYELATCIISRCGLHFLHRGATIVGAGEAEGLPRQGLTLLLALVALISIVRPGG